MTSLANDLIQYFDTWEMTLDHDSREALRPIYEKARSIYAVEKRVSQQQGPVPQGQA